MIKRIIILIVLPLVILCGHANAATRYGISVNSGRFTVEDTDGPTQTNRVGYLAAHMAIPFSRNIPTMRYFNTLSYRQFSLSHGDHYIGQDVRSLSLSSVIQRSFPQSSYRPWVGAGALLGFDDYQHRQVGTNGFIEESYDDKSVNPLGVILNAGFNLRAIDGYYIGLNLNYHRPLGEGISGTNLAITVLW